MRNIGYELPPVVHHDILGWLDVCMHINHAWHDGHSRHVTYDRILRRIYYRARTDICYPAISNNYRSIINDLGAFHCNNTPTAQHKPAQIGRANDSTPVTNAQPVTRLP